MSATLMTHCLVVQHVAPEPAWGVADALARAGVSADVRRLHLGEPLPPDASRHAGVVVMGGPMSATADEGFPTRRAEIALVADALDRGLPVLGICLGAQLLAAAAGATVLAGFDGPEIGWAPVDLTAAHGDDPLLERLPDRLTVLHWHGDTFEMPVGAIHLARSPRYPNQAFRVGPLAWGFQFHIEVTGPAVEGLVRAFPDDAALAPGGAEAIHRASGPALTTLSPYRDLVFDRFAGLVAAHETTAEQHGSPHRFADISDS